MLLVRMPPLLPAVLADDGGHMGGPGGRHLFAASLDNVLTAARFADGSAVRSVLLVDVPANLSVAHATDLAGAVFTHFKATCQVRLLFHRRPTDRLIRYTFAFARAFTPTAAHPTLGIVYKDAVLRHNVLAKEVMAMWQRGRVYPSAAKASLAKIGRLEFDNPHFVLEQDLRTITLLHIHIFGEVRWYVRNIRRREEDCDRFLRFINTRIPVAWNLADLLPHGPLDWRRPLHSSTGLDAIIFTNLRTFVRSNLASARDGPGGHEQPLHATPEFFARAEANFGTFIYIHDSNVNPPNPFYAMTGTAYDNACAKHRRLHARSNRTLYARGLHLDMGPTPEAYDHSMNRLREHANDSVTHVFFTLHYRDREVGHLERLELLPRQDLPNLKFVVLDPTNLLGRPTDPLRHDLKRWISDNRGHLRCFYEASGLSSRCSSLSSVLTLIKESN